MVESVIICEICVTFKSQYSPCLCVNPFCDICDFCVTKKQKIMKAMSKQQLADRAGVSLNTLNRWMKPLQQELEKRGMLPGARMLPPSVVKFIADRFCIDV